MSDLTPTEYLYGIDSTVSDDNRFDQGPRVVQFRITKKTAKRIYYDADLIGRGPQIRFVDRQVIERDGEFVRRSAGWWEPDLRVYLTEPALPDYSHRDLAALKAAMAAAHPDRGGSDEAFIAARSAYKRALAKQSGTEGGQ